jgi:hypothetical protein
MPPVRSIARGLTLALLLCGCRPDIPPHPPVSEPIPDPDSGVVATSPDGGVEAAPPDGTAPADAASAEAPADAPRPADAAPAADAAADVASAGGSCAGPGAVVKTLTPKLFSRGADPSGDPDCAILNPERGMFAFRDLRHLDDIAGLRLAGFTLIYGQVLIPEYRAKDLDNALLDQLTAAFAAVRAAGLKVLPRIYYADGMQADAPLERVLAHIQQLAPLLRANADVIAVLHPGFVGAWGEWHSSTNNLTAAAARKQIYDALLAVLPADRMTLTRRPAFKKDAYGGPLTEASAFSGQPLARVGHLNDCFLASVDDEGTYVVPGEQDYAIADSAFVPVGGETCAVFPPKTACAPALAEMARMHWSFLNQDYHPQVISGWKSGGCFPTVRCRLGFRIALLAHEVPARVKAGDTLSLKVRLVNDGWGRIYNRRPLSVVLTGPGHQVLATDVDPRRWAPGQEVELCLSVKVPAGAAPGTYSVGLWMPDAADSLRMNPAYAVRLANTGWDAATGVSALDASVIVE